MHTRCLTRPLGSPGCGLITSIRYHHYVALMCIISSLVHHFALVHHYEHSSIYCQVLVRTSCCQLRLVCGHTSYPCSRAGVSHYFNWYNMWPVPPDSPVNGGLIVVMGMDCSCISAAMRMSSINNSSGQCKNGVSPLFEKI